MGNRLSSLNVSPYAYNSSNQLTSKPGTTYTYDANGNLTNDSYHTYQWDAAGWRRPWSLMVCEVLKGLAWSGEQSRA